jgi:hypothetical protein
MPKFNVIFGQVGINTKVMIDGQDVGMYLRGLELRMMVDEIVTAILHINVPEGTEVNGETLGLVYRGIDGELLEPVGLSTQAMLEQRDQIIRALQMKIAEQKALIDAYRAQESEEDSDGVH